MEKSIRSGATVILASLITSGYLPAAEAAEEAAHAEIQAITDEVMPDLEFLEFLGQFETDNGEWIGPGNLMAEEFDELLAAAKNIPATEAESTDNNDDQ